MGNKVTAIIQARQGSTRLPGKSLMDLGGKPVLWQMVHRVKQAKEIDKIVVAVPREFKEHAIPIYCTDVLGIPCYRGHPTDLLQRVYDCADAMDTDIIVDLTGDCPLIDPKQIDALVKVLKKEKLDYTSNIWPRSFPDGFDIQVYTYEILRIINGLVTNEKHRCHSGWNIIHYSHLLEKELKAKHFIAPLKYYYPDMGLTLDTPEDYVVLNNIFTHFGNNHFTIENAIDYFLGNPELMAINNNVQRKIPGVDG